MFVLFISGLPLLFHKDKETDTNSNFQEITPAPVRKIDVEGEIF